MKSFSGILAHVPLQYKTVGLTSRSDLAEGDSGVRKVAELIQKCGAKLLLDPKRGTMPALKHCKYFRSPDDIDVLVIVGGDGTILRTVRELPHLQVPLLAINRGTVGFLSELTIDEVPKLLPGFLSGRCFVESRSLLDIVAKRGKKEIFRGRVLNEAVVSQGAISRLIDLRTTINGDPLITFYADGVIIATPTGSTAYSLAAGGPVVHPQLRATILTPINPHSFSQKPLVLPSDHLIEVTIFTKQNKFSDVQVSLTLDGQTYVTLQRNDVVHATVSSETVKFLRRNDETFFSTLRNKLKWGERL
jgi:NAD+ kinase